MKFLGFALGASTILAALAGPASAADMAAPSYSSPFDGFYMGAHGGYAWGQSDASIDRDYELCILGCGGEGPELEDDYSVDPSGAFLGLQAGANFVMDNGLLIGAEVSGSWTAMSDDTAFESDDTDIDSTISVDQDIDAIGLAQAKLGWANESFALYAMGGLALGRVSTSIGIVDDEFFGDLGELSNDETVTGWTAGAGLDYLVHDNVSVGVGYNYVDLGDVDTSGSVETGLVPLFGLRGDVDNEADLHVHMIRASLNYHF